MRSYARIGSGPFGASLLGLSVGIALSGLLALGGAGDALAQGAHAMAPKAGHAYRNDRAAVGHRHAARPMTQRHAYRPVPRLKGHAYRPAPRLKGHAFRPALYTRGHAYRPVRPLRGRYYRSALAPRSCGEFHYWNSGKGQCLDARTAPPNLSPRR